MMEDQSNRAHRPTKAKKKHTGGWYSPPNTTRNLISLDKNPKAFAFANTGRLAKTAARSADVRMQDYIP